MARRIEISEGTNLIRFKRKALLIWLKNHDSDTSDIWYDVHRYFTLVGSGTTFVSAFIGQDWTEKKKKYT